uniref:Importin N-terminal domain-containing protein n=1 Tax=Trichobilharzia regenti TaxID=157069 RepID=A0AA85IRH6_TRIRE|nr:unnamed protein product [Trichobilharzia regenti]
MASDEASVEALTTLLTEFHCPSTSATRRQDIRRLLVDFENSPNSWYHAMYYLNVAKDNQYVVLFCLGVIETTIVHQWPFLLQDHKLKVRTFIQNYLRQACSNECSLLLKKAAKLLSLIACFDWPDQYPDYTDFLKNQIFNDTLSNLLSIRTTLMGLYCLKSMYDSFLNPPEVIDYSRKNELQQFLCKETGTLCGLLCSLMSRLCDDDGKNLFNAPQSYLLEEISRSNQDIQNSLWLPILKLLQSLASDCLTNSGIKCHALITCFECLCEMLKILPSQPISIGEILVSILIFSLVGSPQCLSACAEVEEALALSSQDCDLLRMIGLTALSCLHELVEKRNVDNLMTNQSGFIFQLISCHFNLASGRITLKKFSDSLSQKTQNNDLTSSLAMDRQKQIGCDDYEIKLVEIIRCILPSCLKFVCVSNSLANSFSVNDPITLMKAFFEYTFFTANLETYLSCINIWSNLFESLQFYAHQRSELLSSDSAIHKVLMEFGNALFSRLFYCESAAYLDNLEYDIFENETSLTSYSSKDGSSLLGIVFPEEIAATESQTSEPCEYMVFIRESLSAFRNLVDLLPHDFTMLLFQRFQCILNEYTSLVNASGLLSGVFNFPKGQPPHRIYWILRDFASVVQVVGFMSEKFHCEKYQEYGQQFLRALLYSLRLNSVIFPVLPHINEQLMRFSFVEATVQVLLAWQALIVSGSVGFATQYDSSLSFDKIYLPSADREQFYTELMETFQCFLLPPKDASDLHPSLISSRIVYSCAELFKCLFTSSFRDIHPPTSIMLDINSRSFAIVSNIFEAVCKQNCQTPTEYNIFSPLISAFLCYLTSEDVTIPHLCSHNGSANDEGVKLTSTRNSLLNRLFLEFFLPHLNQENFELNLKQHITYLSLLNNAILALENSGNSARQIVYNSLISSGLMDNLFSCLLNKILVDTSSSYQVQISSEMKVRLCTAYLIFLSTFIRILSFSDGSLSSIPHLIGEIIRSLHKSSAGSNSFSITFIGPIVDILLLITHHKVFTSILQDTVELCLCVFLPLLSTIPNSVFTDNEQEINQLVCSACANNSQLMQQFFELIFKILSNNFSFFFIRKPIISITETTSTLLTPVTQRYALKCPDLFNRLMYVIFAVFHPEQVESSVIRFVVEKLICLNTSHKLFDIYDFNKSWLSMLTSSVLNLIINDKHNSSRDTLINSLYHFALSFTQLSCSYNSADTSHHSNGFSYFVQNFLPTYLNTIQSLDDNQRASILSCFYDTNQNGFYSTDKLKRDLNDISVFNQCIELMIYNIRYYRTINLAMTSVSLANSYT